MHRYRCPSCDSKLDIDRLYDGGYLARCGRCGLTHISRPDADNSDEAYLKLLEDHDESLVKKDVSMEEVLEKEGLLKSKRALEEMVERSGVTLNDLSGPVKNALLSKKDYPVLYRRIPAEEPAVGETPGNLPIDKALAEALVASGIETLYRFQQVAVNELLNSRDVVIVAPTGSGKTEAFAIPMIHLASRGGRRLGALRMGRGVVQVLIIYPTKALARDQLPKLKRLADPVGVRAEVFDGDTPRRERDRVLEDPPDIVVTNFDTLHYHFIHRTRFTRLLRAVKHVVVDEVHVYTGTFGCNVHFILKRLERMCGGFQAVAASATIGNPKEFCDALFGRSFTVVEGGEGKHGVIHFAMLFPTLRSSRALTLELLQHLINSSRKTIAFSSSHLAAELTAFYGKRNGLPIEVHRAGLPLEWRKSVEERFRRGDLKAVSSTPTLELGIDIGTVDAVVSDLVTWTRLTQRIGRAGRRGQESIVFLSLRGNDPISQYYKNNPEDYFKDIESGYVDRLNPVISKFQLLAASIDQPIKKDEFKEFRAVLDEMVRSDLLSEKNGELVPDYAAARRILRAYDIRGAGDNLFIMLQNRKIGERGMPQALDELHPGAVYFHGGTRYRSKSIVYSGFTGRAEVERLPSNYSYYTRPLKEEWPIVTAVYFKKTVLNSEVAYCDLSIMRKVIGYINIEVGAEASKGVRMLLEEPLNYQFQTKGLVFKAPLPQDLLNTPTEKDPGVLAASSFHAAEHVTIEGTNMITGGAASDMGGVALSHSGLIFIYDGSRGGNGATRLLYDRLEDAFKRGYTILKECSCTSEDGCPRCTYSYRCGNNNEYLHRRGAMEALNRILKGEESRIDLKTGPEDRPFV